MFVVTLLLCSTIILCSDIRRTLKLAAVACKVISVLMKVYNYKTILCFHYLTFIADCLL